MTKILIVDSNIDMKGLYEYKLKNKYNMIFSTDGLEALKIVETHTDVDVIVTDVSIPNISGIELVEKIKKIDPLKKSIIISFYGDLDNIRMAMNAGAYDFIIKPIDFFDLEKTINNAIESVGKEKQSSENKLKLLKISEEIDSTAALQKSILPDNNFKYKKVEIYARNDPANEVGGDFYDFFKIDESHVGVVMADVSGKNLSAAMFMSMAKLLLKSFGKFIIDPKKCMDLFNMSISVDNLSGMFVTCFYGVIDMDDNKLRFVNAGHLPPIIINEKRGIEKLQCDSGLPIGVMEDMKYILEEYEIKVGDKILLHTDGVVEATNASNEEYSYSRLMDVLEREKSKDIIELSDNIFTDVKEFTGDTPQFDDITTLCIKYRYKLDT